VALRDHVDQVEVLRPGRLVVAVARDEITAADILFCVEETDNSGLRAYRKVYDLTRIARATPQTDVRLVGSDCRPRQIASSSERLPS
jgi:hypothetical protein